MTKFNLWIKVTKNLRTISKPHEYLQAITKTSVKLERNRHKPVGGVAHTRYPLSIHFDSKNAEKMTKFNLWKEVLKKFEDYIQSTCIFLDHDKNTCKVSNESA